MMDPEMDPMFDPDLHAKDTKDEARAEALEAAYAAERALQLEYEADRAEHERIVREAYRARSGRV